MEQLNDLPDKKFRDSINSSQLLYNDLREREIQISRTTDHENRARNQYVAENDPVTSLHLPNVLMKTQSTFNYSTIQTIQWNLNYGMETFILYCFIAL